MSSNAKLKFSDAVALSAWFGLFYGLLEAVLLLGLYEYSSLWMWKNGVAPAILWIGPTVNLVIFVVGATVVTLLLLPLARYKPALVLPLLVSILAGVSTFGLLMSPRALQVWGCATAAVGVSVQAYRWARRGVSLAFFRGTLVSLAVLVAVLGLGTEVWSQWRERHLLASLPPAPPKAPNVLLIIVDTLRADHVSTYGYSRNTSPNIDRLAAGGILFEKAFAPSHWSQPSHLGILTGRYMGGGGPSEVLKKEFQAFLPVALSANGYATVACSANNMWCMPKAGLGKGFIRFDVYFHNTADRISRTYFGKMLATAVRWYGRYYDIPGRKRAPQVNRELFEWIDRIQPTGRPFFAMLNYFDGHAPYFAPPPFRGQFSPEVTRENLLALHRRKQLRSELTPEDKQLLVDAYDGSVAYLDHWIGELRKELERRRILDQTLIILTADHGEDLGERNQFDHVAPTLRQELIRVPLIIRYPSQIPPGIRVPHPVSLRQIPATVTQFIGAQGTIAFPGRSLLDNWDIPGPPVVIESGLKRALIVGSWHYIFKPGNPPELYNLDEDPQEKQNLAGKPEVASVEAQLHAQLTAIPLGKAD